jgi:hypothetical protein
MHPRSLRDRAQERLREPRLARDRFIVVPLVQSNFPALRVARPPLYHPHAFA